MEQLPFDPTQLGGSVIAIGILLWVTRWFMLRMERVIAQHTKTTELMARAIIRLLEREHPDAASELTRELHHVNGSSSGGLLE